MDIDDFLTWHTARTKRRTGQAPAASTLRSTKTRLRIAMRAAGVDELSVLPDTLTNEAKCEALFDKLSLTNSSGSLRLVYESLKSFSDYARAQGWMIEPLAVAPPSKNLQPPIVVYRAAEVERLVEAARGRSLRWFIFLATVAHTGRRVGEVLALEWDWLHLDSDVPHFELPHTKNKRQHYVPLDVFLQAECFTPANVACLKTDQGSRFARDPAAVPFPWSYSCADKMFRRHCAKVGVECRGFHRFRHTLATDMITRGVPLQAVSALLGHSNIGTTDRLYNHARTLDYAHFLERDGKQVPVPTWLVEPD